MIAEHKTRDAAALAARGALNSYHHSVLALVLLMERPSLLN